MKYDLNDVPSVAIIFMLTAVFFVVAIIILSSLGNNSNFSPSTSYAENVTVPALQGNVSLSKNYLVSIQSIVNGTGATLDATNYTLLNTGVSSVGVVQFLDNKTSCITGKSCYVTYTFNNHNSTSGTVITKSIEAMSEIPNNWLLLIAVVLAAAIIIGIVMNNMSGYSMGRQ